FRPSTNAALNRLKLKHKVSEPIKEVSLDGVEVQDPDWFLLYQQILDDLDATFNQLKIFVLLSNL
ncbi:unnamed protein product, partial [Ilex paraguariensis]